jgi:hypothetical protein
MTEMMIMMVGLYVIGRCFSDFHVTVSSLRVAFTGLGGWWANTLFVLTILQCKFLTSVCVLVVDWACDLDTYEMSLNRLLAAVMDQLTPNFCPRACGFHFGPRTNFMHVQLFLTQDTIHCHHNNHKQTPSILSL